MAFRAAAQLWKHNCRLRPGNRRVDYVQALRVVSGRYPRLLAAIMLSLVLSLLATPIEQARGIPAYFRLVGLMLRLAAVIAVGALLLFKATLSTRGWTAAVEALLAFLKSLLPYPFVGWLSKPVGPIPTIVLSDEEGEDAPPAYAEFAAHQELQEPVDEIDEASDWLSPMGWNPTSRPPAGAPSKPNAAPPYKAPKPIPPPPPDRAGPDWGGVFTVLPTEDARGEVYEAKFWNGAPLPAEPEVIPPAEGTVAQPQREWVRAGDFRFPPSPGGLAPPALDRSGRIVPDRLVRVRPGLTLLGPREAARPVRLPPQVLYDFLDVPKLNGHGRLRPFDQDFYFSNPEGEFALEPTVVSEDMAMMDLEEYEEPAMHGANQAWYEALF